ncbi:MAG: hypothetical protein JWN38_1127 [Candidatus Saccharibacteria bacterium]|nr:hypothetical protein [Candidatus Saccharibacteria bacterium]
MSELEPSAERANELLVPNTRRLLEFVVEQPLFTAEEVRLYAGLEVEEGSSFTKVLAAAKKDIVELFADKAYETAWWHRFSDMHPPLNTLIVRDKGIDSAWARELAADLLFVPPEPAQPTFFGEVVQPPLPKPPAPSIQKTPEELAAAEERRAILFTDRLLRGVQDIIHAGATGPEGIKAKDVVARVAGRMGVEHALAEKLVADLSQAELIFKHNLSGKRFISLQPIEATRPVVDEQPSDAETELSPTDRQAGRQIFNELLSITPNQGRTPKALLHAHQEQGASLEDERFKQLLNRLRRAGILATNDSHSKRGINFASTAIRRAWAKGSGKEFDKLFRDWL